MGSTRKSHSTRKHSTRKSHSARKSRSLQIAMDSKARTFQGLNHWHVHLFKNFGWMVLEKARGNHIKIESYKDSTNRLLQSLEFRLKDIHEKDRKEDLLIMINNVKILKKFIDKEM